MNYMGGCSARGGGSFEQMCSSWVTSLPCFPSGDAQPVMPGVHSSPILSSSICAGPMALNGSTLDMLGGPQRGGVLEEYPESLHNSK